MPFRHHVIRALLIAVVAACATPIYELTKDVLHRDQHLLQLQLITFSFAAFFAFVITIVVRRQEDVLQAQYKYLFEQANDAILVFEPESEIILDANDKAYELYEFDRPELLGISVTALTKDVEKGKQSSQFQHQRAYKDFESVHRTKTGRQIHVLINSSIIKLRGQKAALSIIRDITEYKRAREAIRESEERMRLANLATGDLTWDLDMRTGHGVRSHNFWRHFGHDAETQCSSYSEWQKYIHADDRDGIWSKFQHALRCGEERWTGEYRFLRSDGTYAHVLDRAYITYDDHKQPIRATGVISDISDREAAEASIRRLAEIVQQSNDAIISVTLEGRVTGWNKAAERMYGYSSSEVLGQHISFSVPPKQKHEPDELLAAVARGKHIEQFCTERVGKDGVVFDVSLSVSPLRDGNGSLVGASAIIRDITAQKKANEQLTLQSAALEAAANAILIADAEGTIVWVNDAFTHLTGYQRDEVVGRKPRILKSGEQPPSFYTDLWSTIKSGRVWQGEVVNKRKDGSTYREEMTITPVVQGENGKASYFIAIKQDITAKKTLEQQLHQAQKMEAIGRLAGGVAHDFNNMLGVITGYSELLKSRNDLDELALYQIDEIHAAANRAVSLTRQLLAFSRKQIVQPRIMDLNESVSSLTKMLRRLIGDDIELTIRLSENETRIKADSGQVEQVIMNLAINARDAMPNGGKLIIETEVCTLDESYAFKHKPVKPGTYVRLSLTDTGSGMDKDTMSHLFEPFFTTKELGRGTGLGLSIVYGIVKQAEGYIWVYSEPAHGTCFKIYFPLQAEKVESVTPAVFRRSKVGTETILLVEDDDNFRTLLGGYLSRLGYKVLQSSNGKEALDRLSEHSTTLDALIADIMMPGMNGRDVAETLLLRFPDLKVLYMSGYTHDGAVQTRVLRAGELFLQKPFGLAELSTKLREALGRPRSLTHPQSVH